jgi:uncharacterized delta-60 repeat protein
MKRGFFCFSCLLLALFFLTPLYAADLSVLTSHSYDLVSEKRIDRDTWAYRYKLTVRNNGTVPLSHVCGTVESTFPAVKVIDNKVCFAPIDPGATVASKGAFSLRTGRHPYTPSSLRWTFTSLTISADPSTITMQKGTTQALSYSVTLSTTRSRPYLVAFHQHIPHHLSVTPVPRGWETDHTMTWNVTEQVTANETGKYAITGMSRILGIGQHARIRVPVTVTAVPPAATLSKPTSWPNALNLGTTQVTFTVAAPSATPPAAITLEQQTPTGWQSVATLLDNGQSGDLKANDAIYSADLPVNATAEGTLWFRARADGFSPSEPYGLVVTPYPLGPAPADPATYVTTDDGMPLVGNRLLVTFAEGTSSAAVNSILSPFGGRVVGTLPGVGSCQVEIPFTGDASGVMAAIVVLQGEPSVLFAEPDYLMQPAGDQIVPMDTGYPYQWGPQYIGAEYAWYLTQGRDVMTAVVDFGVDYNHIEFDKKVPCGTLPDQLCDRVIKGTNYTVSLTDPSRNYPMDDTGHGTNVAGVVAAAANNNIGIAGVAWDSQILAIKACNNSGGCTSSNMASAIAEAAASQAKIINISLELRDPSTGVTKPSWHVQHQVEEASKNNKLVVIAAGNSANTSFVYPAAYVSEWDDVNSNAVITSPDPSPCALTVAMIDSSASFQFSTHGDWVSLAAPGYNIYTLVKGDGYDIKSGSSMAAPHVSGIAAILWSLHPTWSVDEIRARLEATAIAFPGVAKGIVNAGSAVVGTIVAWDTPLPITYRTLLGPTQLNARANVAGTFDYSPGAGTALDASTQLQTLSVTFTPADQTLYPIVTKTVTLMVNQATPTMTWNDTPAAITYGTTLTDANVVTNPPTFEGEAVPGAYAYYTGGPGNWTPLAGPLSAGDNQIVRVIFTPTNPNFTLIVHDETISVQKATPVITWSVPSDIMINTPPSVFQTATASVGGTFAYDPTPSAGTGQTYRVTFTPADSANYNTVSTTVSINVWNPFGTLDPTFGDILSGTTRKGFAVSNGAAGGNFYDRGYSITLDSTGRILATGYSYSSTGGYDMVIWRYTDAGQLDTSFGNGTGFVVHNGAAGEISQDLGYSITLDPTGRILVTGYSYNGPRDFMVIWRYTDTGQLDTSFGNGTGFVVHNGAAGENGGDSGQSVALDPTGRILVAGFSHNNAGNPDMVIWRYTDTGQLDTSFGYGTGFVVHNGAAGGDHDDRGQSIVLDSTGRILVTGYSYRSEGNFDMTIWRYTDTGQLDTSFGNGAGFVVHNGAAEGNYDDFGYSTSLDPTGRILVTGESDNGAGNRDMVIWRYTDTGQLDTSFGNGGIVVHNGAAGGNGNDSGYSITFDPTGRILVTGESDNGAGYYDMVIWRYLDTGQLDTSFGNGGIVVHNGAAGGNGNDSGYSITFDPTGRILVTGESDNGAGNPDMVIWRYLAGAPATVTLDSAALSATYDGTPKAVTALTSPAGLPLLITYNGSTTPPSDAGTYTVAARVTDAIYAGGATGQLAINRNIGGAPTYQIGEDRIGIITHGSAGSYTVNNQGPLYLDPTWTAYGTSTSTVQQPSGVVESSGAGIVVTSGGTQTTLGACYMFKGAVSEDGVLSAVGLMPSTCLNQPSPVMRISLAKPATVSTPALLNGDYHAVGEDRYGTYAFDGQGSFTQNVKGPSYVNPTWTAIGDGTYSFSTDGFLLVEPTNTSLYYSDSTVSPPLTCMHLIGAASEDGNVLAIGNQNTICPSGTTFPLLLRVGIKKGSSCSNSLLQGLYHVVSDDRFGTMTFDGRGNFVQNVQGPAALADPWVSTGTGRYAVASDCKLTLSLDNMKTYFNSGSVSAVDPLCNVPIGAVSADGKFIVFGNQGTNCAGFTGGPLTVGFK